MSPETSRPYIPDEWANKARCPVCGGAPLKVRRQPQTADQMVCVRCHSSFEIEEGGGKLWFTAIAPVLAGTLEKRWVTILEVGEAVRAVMARRAAKTHPPVHRAQEDQPPVRRVTLAPGAVRSTDGQAPEPIDLNNTILVPDTDRITEVQEPAAPLAPPEADALEQSAAPQPPAAQTAAETSAPVSEVTEEEVMLPPERDTLPVDMDEEVPVPAPERVDESGSPPLPSAVGETVLLVGKDTLPVEMDAYDIPLELPVEREVDEAPDESPENETDWLERLPTVEEQRPDAQPAPQAAAAAQDEWIAVEPLPAAQPPEPSPPMDTQDFQPAHLTAGELSQRAHDLRALGNSPAQIREILTVSTDATQAEILIAVSELTQQDQKQRGNQGKTVRWFMIAALVLLVVMMAMGWALRASQAVKPVRLINLPEIGIESTLPPESSAALLVPTPSYVRGPGTGVIASACPKTAQQAAALFGGRVEDWSSADQISWFLFASKPSMVRVPENMTATLVSGSGESTAPLILDGPATIYNAMSASIACR